MPVEEQVDEGDTQIASKKTVGYVGDMSHIEDETAVSLGFNFVTRPVVVGGKTIGDETVLGLQFRLRDEILSSNAIMTHVLRIAAVAPPEDVIVEYPFKPGDDTLAKIDYFMPEVVTDIDCAVLNAGDEVEALDNLANVVIPVDRHTTPQLLGAVQDYTESLIQFDHRVPYEIAFQGLAYRVIQGEEDIELEPTVWMPINVWGYPESIELVSYAHVEGDKLAKDFAKYVFALRVNLLSPEGNDDQMSSMVIPLGPDFTLASIRKTYYAKG